MWKFGKPETPVAGTELPIEKVVVGAQKVEQRIVHSMPQETTIRDLAVAVATTARLAGVRVRIMKGPFAMPRIRL